MEALAGHIPSLSSPTRIHIILTSALLAATTNIIKSRNSESELASCDYFALASKEPIGELH